MAALVIIGVIVGIALLMAALNDSSSRSAARSTHSPRRPLGGQPAASAPPAISLGTLLKSGLNLRVDLSYEDRDGTVTARQVTIAALYGKKGDRSAWVWVNWVVGYCHLRQEQRHFAVARIRSIALPDAPSPVMAGHVEKWLATLFRIRRTRDLIEPIRAFSPDFNIVWQPSNGEREEYCASFISITGMGGAVFEARLNGTRAATATRKARSGEKVLDFSKGDIILMTNTETGAEVVRPMHYLMRLADGPRSAAGVQPEYRNPPASVK